MSFSEKSRYWWWPQSAVTDLYGKEKPRNERFRHRAFQKIKNYQNRFSRKKLQLCEVGGFWKKFGNPGIFVSEIWDLGSETVRDSENV